MRAPTRTPLTDPAAPVTVTAGELADRAFDTALTAHYLARTTSLDAGRRTIVEILARLAATLTDLATPPGPTETKKTTP